MLDENFVDALPDPLIDLYDLFIEAVIKDIARRLAGMKYESAAWQVQRLNESGMLYNNILDELSKITGQSESTLREIFQTAGVETIKYDDKIYQAAGLRPRPLNLSPEMGKVLQAGLQKTNNILKNLTSSTALAGQDAFLDAADLAYMQVSSGTFDYISAIKVAVKEVAGKGLSSIGFSGRRDQLDVSVRRAVLTGIGQTTGNLQIARADEMNCDLVGVSAHVGARNTGEGPANHESWQGQIYSRSGSNRKYKNFAETTGYGTGEGLLGWGCRHSFYPFFPGLSKNAYSQAELKEYANKTVKYNGQEMPVYDATQIQRGIERKIRFWKRQIIALEGAGIEDNMIEVARMKNEQRNMRDFIKQMNEQYKPLGIKWHRQPEREQI